VSGIKLLIEPRIRSLVHKLGTVYLIYSWRLCSKFRS